jgi:hypothetical protein
VHANFGDSVHGDVSRQLAETDSFRQARVDDHNGVVLPE